MPFDENKRLIACPHIDVEPIEKGVAKFVCNDCGTHFVHEPRVDQGTARPRSGRMPRRKKNA